MPGPSAGGLAHRLRPQDPDAARELGRACGVGAATAQVLLHRGYTGTDDAKQFLAPRLAGLTAPDEMADRLVAAERIARAVRTGERVVVFGDYDVDGSTSTAIIADIIEAVGGDVRAFVANRFEGGYGFSDEALDRCRGAGARLIVTCDCGSSDHERIARARREGIDVVVVDHHLVPSEPLPALAFLNPHRPDCGFPYKGLASAGLALSVGAAVRKATGASIDLRRWLDLVALGTIADVAPLDGDNRRLVRAGLDLLSSERPRPGVLALRETAKISGRLSGIDVSFRLAPRLNAAGRLGDPTVTLELLRARTIGQARGLAARIEQLNDQRKLIERAVTEEAIAEVVRVYGERPETGIVVAREGWHAGVVGITAARLVDRFGMPAVVIGLDGAMGRGSGRTPEGFPLYDAIARCADGLEAFGGHQAAAGLTVRTERVEALRADFADATRDLLRGRMGKQPPLADVQLDGSVFPLPSPQDLLGLEPLGEANAEPLFVMRGVRVEQASAVGEGMDHLKLLLRVGPQRLRAFGYDLGSRAGTIGKTIDVLGHVRIDHYRGGRSVELRVTDLA